MNDNLIIFIFLQTKRLKLLCQRVSDLKRVINKGLLSDIIMVDFERDQALSLLMQSIKVEKSDPSIIMKSSRKVDFPFYSFYICIIIYSCLTCLGG